MLITLSGKALSQTNSDEPSVFFHAGSSEQLASLCRAVDEAEAMVGSKITIVELIRVSKKAGLCIGIIKATIDSDIIAHTDQAVNVAGRDVCVPTEASEKELAKVLIKYDDDHAQQLHYPAAFTVLLAMREAFPCR
jgi:Rap1a immunity proteins